MSNYTKHAWREFQIAGWCDENRKFECEMQEAICNHVIKLLDVFDGGGHSGSSAPYTLNLFKKLAMFQPVSALTGEDDEWHEASEGVFQNKRDSAVFKQADRFEGQAYDLDGRVFWEWYKMEDGEMIKSYFTNRDSMVPIEFPWVRPDRPEYVFCPTEEFPNEVL